MGNENEIGNNEAVATGHTLEIEVLEAGIMRCQDAVKMQIDDTIRLLRDMKTYGFNQESIDDIHTFTEEVVMLKAKIGKATHSINMKKLAITALDELSRWDSLPQGKLALRAEYLHGEENISNADDNMERWHEVVYKDAATAPTEVKSHNKNSAVCINKMYEISYTDGTAADTWTQDDGTLCGWKDQWGISGYGGTGGLEPTCKGCLSIHARKLKELTV